MKRLGILALGALLVLVALAYLAPATLADRLVGDATRHTLRVAQAEGTLWAGRGWLTNRSGSWRLPVNWRVSLPDLFKGEVRLDLGGEPGSVGPVGTLRRAGNGVEFERLSARVPAYVLDEALRGVAARAGGEISVEASNLVWPPAGSPATLAGEWREARIDVPGAGAIDLGRITMQLASRGEALSGPIQGRGRDLAIDGEATLEAGRARVALKLSPTADTGPMLRQALGALGRADATGAVSVLIDRPLR